MRCSLTIRLIVFAVGAVVLWGTSRVMAAPATTATVRGSCPDGGCGTAPHPWISLTFSGEGWTARTVQTVLADLRADLVQRQIDLDLPANRKKGSADPIASIDIAKEGANAVAIQVDIPEGGATRRLSRVTALDAVTNDGRPLAIALTAGELLRVSWVRIALRRAAEKAAAVTAAQASPSGVAPFTPDGASAPDPSTPGGPSDKPAATRPPTESMEPGREPTTVASATENPAPGAADVVVSGPPPLTDETGPLNFGMALEGTWLFAPPTSTRNVPTSKGVGVRGAVSGRRYGVTAGFLVPTEASLDVGDATARERRFVFDAGARVVWRGPYLNVGADVGLLLAYRRIDGVGLARNTGASGVDGGLRGGVVVAFGQSRLTPWLGAAVQVLPFSPSIAFAPAANAGRSPPLWVGASAGISARISGQWWP